MIVRTEFSFRTAYGMVERVLDRLPLGGIVADDGAWGHVPFAAAAAKAGKKFGLGWRVRVAKEPEGREDWRELILVARDNAGLRELYGLVALAHRQFHWFPRLTPRDLAGAGEPGSGIAILAAPGRRNGTPPDLPPGALRPFVPGLALGREGAFSDNFYPSPEDRTPWAFSLGSKAWTSSAPAHILGEGELRAEGASEESLRASRELLEAVSGVTLPKAENIRFRVADPVAELRALCEGEFSRRALGAEHRERLERELALVAEKGFADYFLVIADMIRWAKQRMLVGPGRGSSAGSLVCWLLRITEVDPLAHGLLFDRFIDTNRFDMPDIDIDFPDERRAEVLAYLAEKYGQANVAHIGTVMRYKPKSALTDVAKELKVPAWELDAFKDSIIERSSGDSRVNDCLRDTFEVNKAGKELLRKYPELEIACQLEGGARQSGKHAAGWIVCNEPVEKFCAVGRDAVAQIDKKSAEKLNILKIDALGLRTLSVLQTACDVAGIDFHDLYDLPLDDAKAIDVFNQRRWSGIFQFEGQALQSVAEQITFREFDDIAALTALARPGALGGGETAKWVDRHEGRAEVVYPHPLLKGITERTFGTIIYQEQVMRATREIGGFSWADTAAIRKLMSARQGNEAFRKFEEQFMRGAEKNGMEHDDALKLWRAIDQMGMWSFNLSHAVVYGLLSYWCAWLKAHHPLAFAAGCLRHSKDTDSARGQLRELLREGFEFTPLDPEKSEENWSVADGKLLGGLLGVPGIGPKTAREILVRRRNGMELKPGHQKLLARGSVFARCFPTREKFGEWYREPAKFGIRLAPLMECADVSGRQNVVLIGRLVKKSLRDANEEKYLVRRGGVRVEGQTKMLILHIEDDSGRITGFVSREKFERIGAEIAEKGVVGETWLAVRGFVNGDKLMNVEAVRWIGEEGA